MLATKTTVVTLRMPIDYFDSLSSNQITQLETARNSHAQRFYVRALFGLVRYRLA